MATVDKNFRVKNGLVVEGTTGTINGNNIVTNADTTDIISEGTTNLYFTNQRAIDAVTGGVDTDEITEGTTNLYFTDQRVQDVLVDAIKENIQITSTDGILYITAENGVADSSTDDLEEGTVNLYFTPQRALDAVAGGSFSTDAVEEGTINLYFTDQRALDATALAYDPAGSAAQALTDAEDYADGLATNYEASGAVSTHSDLTTGVHGVTGDVVGTSDAQTLTNKTMGDDLLMDGNQVSGLATPTQADHAATKSYVDNTATGIVTKPQVLGATSANIDATYDNGDDGVGATLTFNSNGVFPAEAAGATGWAVGKGILVKNQTNKAQNGRYVITDMGSVSTPYVLTRCGLCDEADEIPGAYIFVQDGNLAGTGWIQVVNDPATFVVGTDDIDVYQFSGEGTYTAGNGLELNGTTFSIDETITATRTFASEEASAAQEAAESYADGLAVNYDAAGSAAAAQSAAESYADGLAVNYDAAGTAQGIVDALDTDDISEGTTNLYHTTQRVYDALASSVQENISVTTTDGMLYITAENGVADATTDDLDEGTINLYFTDQKAVDALEAIVPNFTAVEINSVSKQVASTTEVTTSATPTAVFTFDSTEYRSGKFLVKGAFGDHTEISEVLLTLDELDNIAITEYAIVGTNGNLINVTAIFSAGDVVLQVSAVNANTDVTVFGTLIV